jgi:hypothetical protein
MHTFPRNPVVLLVVTLALLQGGVAPAFSKTRGPSASGSPDCNNVTRPFHKGKVLHNPWLVDSPPDDITYKLSGVTSTAYPSPKHPNVSVFTIGDETAAARTCFEGGRLKGTALDRRTWEFYHDRYNAACIRIIATDWMTMMNLRCDDVEDGFRPKETSHDANNVTMYVSGSYLTRVRDDCIENDGTIGGVFYDSLWRQCFTGVSEKPNDSQGSWTSPNGETLTLDHMLIGLYETPTAEGKHENALFKWSSSANDLVIKCSIFKVDSVSINGTGTMKIPDGTVVDDSACPRHPSTIVWLGRGKYPAATAGIRVTTNAHVWKRAVNRWICTHNYPGCN